MNMQNTSPNRTSNKLFIGGINSETTQDELKDYFSQFGSVIQVLVVLDKDTFKSRRFGFVIMKDESSIEKILSLQPHFIQNKQIELKYAHPTNAIEKYDYRNGRSACRYNKLFIGGIGNELKERDLVEYFARFGEISECTVKRNNGVSRGFGFVIFKNEHSINELLGEKVNMKISLKGLILEIKRAVPKESSSYEQKDDKGTIFNEKLLFMGDYLKSIFH